VKHYGDIMGDGWGELGYPIGDGGFLRLLKREQFCK